MFACLLSLVPVSQVEVGCPWARGLQLQLHPKVEEHPQAYQPATQPRVPPPPLCPAPPTIAPVILRLKQGKKKSQEGGGDPKPRKQREGGEPRETLHYLHYQNATPCLANKAQSTLQTKRRHMACACAKATYHWTGICPHAPEQW